MGEPIVDAHLDLADNVLRGRDYTLEVAEIRARENAEQMTCTVSLPELRRGGVAVAFATLYVGPDSWSEDDQPVYDSPPAERGRSQIAVYRRWSEEGRA